MFAEDVHSHPICVVQLDVTLVSFFACLQGAICMFARVMERNLPVRRRCCGVSLLQVVSHSFRIRTFFVLRIVASLEALQPVVIESETTSSGKAHLFDLSRCVC